MADTITTTTGVYDIVATYDGNGNPTGLCVRYLRTFTNVTTGQSWSVIRGPVVLSVVAYANVLATLLSTMPSGSGQ
jgi:hypothetical protein